MPNTPDTQKEEIFAIQNIFGKPPGWLVNWGITAAFLFLIVCLGIAAFVKYPDKLVMPAKLFTENPPVELISKVNAEIDSIYIKDKSPAKQGDVLLKFRSTVDEYDLDVLRSFFARISSIDYIPEYLNVDVPKGLNLGIMSTPWYNNTKSFSFFYVKVPYLQK